MSKKIILGLVVVLIIILGFGLTFSQVGNNQTRTESSQSQSATSSTGYNFLSLNTVQDLQKRLDAKNPNDVLLDVRTPTEFRAGHISGAVNLDMENPNFETQIQSLDKTKTYLVFCRSGNRALIASQKMSDIGLKVIYSREGITSWQSAGLKVEL